MVLVIFSSEVIKLFLMHSIHLRLSEEVVECSTCLTLNLRLEKVRARIRVAELRKMFLQRATFSRQFLDVTFLLSSQMSNAGKQYGPSVFWYGKASEALQWTIRCMPSGQ